MSATPPRRIGRYELLRCLGASRLRESWLAQSQGVAGFQKRAVLKTLRADLSGATDLVHRFVAQAKLAAHLNHPRIAQVFDFGEADGRTYIAVEHVSGRTLRSILDRLGHSGRRMPVWFSLRVAADACEGLQYAHALRDEEQRPLGIVHGDLRPEALMVSFTGGLKILEFRGAHAAAPTRGLAPGAPGDARYRPAEQIRTGVADRRADIYSLGAVLGECLTGERPVPGEPLSAAAAHIPKELRVLIGKATARLPEQRHPDAAALRSELLSALRRHHADDAHHSVAVQLAEWFAECSEIPASIRGLMSSLPHEEGSSPFIELGTEDVEIAAPITADTDRISGTYEKAAEPRTGTSVFERPTPTRLRTDDADVFAVRRATSPAARDVFSTHRGDSRPVAPAAPPSEPRPVAAVLQRFDRGLSLARDGLYRAALDEWEAALALDPTNRTVQANLKRLRSLIDGTAPGVPRCSTPPDGVHPRGEAASRQRGSMERK